MSDIFTRRKRSEVMARIRGSGNGSTELLLIAVFRTHGITGWRRKAAVFGKPDFVLPKQRLAVLWTGVVPARLRRPVLSPHSGSELAWLPDPRHATQGQR